MTEELMTAFDDSLNALTAGESVSTILARYPHLDRELRPMLEAAQAARRHGAGATVPAAAQRQSRAQLLARAAALRERRQTARGFLGLAALKAWTVANRTVAITLAFLLGFTLGTYGVLTASAQSLPGEPLYGVKRTLEQTQLLLAFDPRAREQLATDFNDRRVTEVERLLSEARQAQVVFGGELEQMDGERWTVAGIGVIVPSSAEVVGTPFPGLYVAVDGLSQAGGTVVATRVEVTGIAFIGVVRVSGPSTWQVDDRVLLVNADTVLTGAPQPGDWVSVSARRLPDGSWLALRIALNPSGPVNAPTSTPAPTPTTAATSTQPAPASTPAPAATERATEVRFTGSVESIGAQSWQIAGQSVRLTAATEIRDNPQVGQTVEVRALRADDGTLTALRIELDESGPAPANTPEPDDDDNSGGGPGPSPSHTPEPDDDGSDDGDGARDNEGSGGDDVQELRWEGTLDAISGATWVVAGQAVTVNSATEIRDNPQPGDAVEVRALRQPDGSWLAIRVDKK